MSRDRRSPSIAYAIRSLLAALACGTALLLSAAPASAQFPISESFQNTTAPGWVLGGNARLTAAPPAPIDPVGSGWLRLTDATNTQAGFAYFNTAIPATQGLSIEFEYATYGGTPFAGVTGDGISFFLFNGATPTFTVGAPGGSLGYAQSTTQNGMSNGYVGIGLDEFGNYSSPGFGHSGGPGSRRDSIAIRGPGNGMIGYPYLTGTNTLVPGIPTGSRPASTTATNYRKVFIDIVPTPTGYTIALRLQRGTTVTEIIAPFAVTNPPPTVKFGFAASTGGATNIHEIRLVKVSQPVNHAIAKTDGLTSVAIGSPITYTITARNTGPNADPAAIIQDTVPAAITGVTWTCAATGTAACGAASGSGNTINTTASLPANNAGTVTYTVSGTVGATAAPIVNTATVTASAALGDTDLTNNTATDTTTPTTADLTIAKTDNTSTYVPGAATTYTIDVTNNGPFAATNARVQDALPAGTTGAWTCTPVTAGATCGAASGVGAIDQLVSLPVGGTVRFQFAVTTLSSASGSLVNTATVTPPSTLVDPTPGNNAATDTDTPSRVADLAVSKTATPNPYVPGATLTYRVIVTNLGPSDVANAILQEPLPGPLTSFTWTCTGGSGGTCGTASGSGNIVGASVTLPRGGTATFVITGTVPPSTTGQLVNTATVTAPSGVTDPVPGNNHATVTNPSGPQADLAVTKSSTPNPYVPGAPLTYTVIVSNRGPSAVTGARVQDMLPAPLGAFTWNCGASSGSSCDTASGTGSINTLVTLLPNGTATFTITGTVPSGTGGSLTNTATVTPPAGTTDPVPGNNTGTDTNPSNPTADLSITKASAPNPYVPGAALTYTIVVTNNGVSDVTGARVQDAPPAPASSFAWTCASSGGTCGTANGVGLIDALVNLPAGATATFTLSGTIAPDVRGALLNTATVAPPFDVTDPTPGNNEATDNNGAAPRADLTIVKSASPDPYVPGRPLTYTITVGNNGPSAVFGAHVQDALPDALAGFTWTCTPSAGASCGTAAGSGDIDSLVMLPVGGTATFTVTGTLPASTTGSLANTATVAPPPGTTDPTPGNNTSTTTTPGAPEADLSITKTSTPSPYVPGAMLTYTLVVRNVGPSDAIGASVQDVLPVPLAGFTWTCSAAGGGSCGSPTGAGDVNTLVNLPVNATATFTIAGRVPSSTTGPLTNTATVAPPAGTTDPVPGNNSATDIGPFSSQADLVISKSSTPNPYVPGSTLTYTIVATNLGPSDVAGARVQDTLPPALSAVTWTCTGANGGICTASGGGNIDQLVTLPNGASVTFAVTGAVPPTTVGTLPNTSTIAPPAGTTDPVPGNNSATDTNPSNPTADLSIAKTSLPNPYVPGESLTFLVQVMNSGPSSAPGARVQDLFPAAASGFTWTCTANADAACSTPSGTGSIDTTVDLDPGGVVLFEITGTVPSGTTGTLSNAATVTPPPTVTDPVPGNNTSTTTNPASPQADLRITKSSTPNPFVAGEALTYTIVVTNAGPSDVANARVLDMLPAPFSAFTWTCTAASGSCSIENGTGQVDTLVSLPAGTTATISIVGTVPPGTPAATISNTATVTPPADVTDPIPGNNQDTDVNTGTLQADLSVTKSSTPNPYVPGATLTYTIRVMNAGPSNVANAHVQDALPAPLAAFTWTCTASSGSACATASGTGSLDTLVSLIVGGTATFTVTGVVPSSTTGPLTNTATIAPPADVADLVPGNNSASDTNPTGAVADLSIAKSSTPKPYVPGDVLTLTLTVSNAGPSDVSNARVQDALPPTLAGFAWTCAATNGTCGTASGVGDIDALVSLSAGTGTATFTITGTTPPAPIVQLTNTATVAPPADVRDPEPGNNSATDNNPAGPQADLAIAKTASPDPFVPGATLTYTITATNNGPTGVTNARVQDALPPELNGFAWSCASLAGGGVCVTPDGTGSIDALVTLPAAGASVLFMVTGTAPSSASAAFANTGTIAPPPGTDDPTPGNNTSTTTTPPNPQADLVVTKTSAPNPYVPGQHVTYTIAVTNAGPSDAIGARVQDALPAPLAGFAWTCTPDAGAACQTTAGVGDIDALVDLAAAASATFTVQGTLASNVSGPLVNSVSVSPPPGTTDPTPGNNTSTDTATPAPQSDLSVTKTSAPNPFAPGAPLTYTIIVFNNGPSDAVDARLVDALPAALAGFTWTCASSNGASCATSGGTGAIDTLVTLPAGESLSIVLTGTAAAGATETIVNSVTIAPPAGTIDPEPGDNTATDSNASEPRADIQITKTTSVLTPRVGDEVTFTVTATNNGPSDATGVAATDALPNGLRFVAATPSQGTYAADSGLWTIGALANGASATLQIQARVMLAGLQTNTATKTAGDQIDPDTSNNSAAAALTADPVADVRLVKTADAVNVNVGSQVTFTIVVSNAGPSAATHVHVADPLPPGLTLVSAFVSDGTFDAGMGTWDIPTLAAEGEATLTLTALVTQAGPIVNLARKISQTELDPLDTNDASGVTVNGLSSDLQVVKIASVPPGPIVGQDVTFFITATNNGPSAATGVRIADALPAGLFFVSSTASRGIYVPASGVWEIGSLDVAGPGATATLRIVARLVSAPASLTNTASVATSDQPDPNPLNNDASAVLLPAAVDLDTRLTRQGHPSLVGTMVDFYVDVTNRGAGTSARPITVALPLTPEVRNNAMPQAGWTCTTVGRVVFCRSDATLTTGQFITAGFWVDVLAPPPPGRTVFAHVTTETDLSPENNVTQLQIGPPPDVFADVAVTQDVSVSGGDGGGATGTLTYTVRVSNQGPAAATDVVLTDVIPAGATLGSATVAGGAGTCEGQAFVACELGTIAPGGAVTVTIVLTAPSPSVVVHTVSASGGQSDPAPGSNQSVLVQTLGGSDTTDTDADGMPDAWESFMGLSVLAGDAGGDPDGDGVSNVDEYRRGTHPRGFFQRYFAEGVGGDFFTTTYGVLNLSAAQSSALLVEYMPEGAVLRSEPYRLGSMHRLTIDPTETMGSTNATYATLIESDQPIAADRTMSWGTPSYGAHAETGMSAPSATWHFAEGVTGPFELFYLLQNPNAAPATVDITFLRPAGPPVPQPVTIPPFERYTLHVNAIPALAADMLSASIQSSVPIVAERAMYFGPFFQSGTDSAGAPTLATVWFFAEGATGSFFEEFILIANPGDTPAEISAQFARPDGQTVTRPYTIAPRSRFTILVDEVDPLVAATAVAVTLTSTNGVPIVAERAMYWPDGAWQEGHVSLGATTTGVEWAVASGSYGGPQGAQTYVLIANTSADSGHATVTVISDDGARASRTWPLEAHVRQTIDIAAEFPDAVDRRFSVLVESIGATPVPIVVETACYWSTPDTFWAAGTSALAAKVR